MKGTIRWSHSNFLAKSFNGSSRLAITKRWVQEGPLVRMISGPLPAERATSNWSGSPEPLNSTTNSYSDCDALKGATRNLTRAACCAAVAPSYHHTTRLGAALALTV